MKKKITEQLNIEMREMSRVLYAPIDVTGPTRKYRDGIPIASLL